MKKVALTGGIATGKSYVLDRFRRLGVPCLDADALAHGIMGAGTEATAAIAARFGTSFLDAAGAVNRQALGPVVFADPAARRDLEAIVHPAVYRAIEAGLRAFERTGSFAFAMIDIPLLYETGRAHDFDAVVATTAPVDAQIARLTARGLTATAAHARLAAQLPAAEKARRADFVIDTGGTFADTGAQVDQVFKQLQQRLG